jgi:general secretion pathway protein E
MTETHTKPRTNTLTINLNSGPPVPSTGIDAPGLVERLVHQAESVGASDLHLQKVGATATVSLRLDGLITPWGDLPEPLAERVFGRIKFLARLKTYQESLPQDGRINRAELGSANDVRVATYPTVTGEKIVLRLFSEQQARGLDELDLPEPVRHELERFLRQSSGLLLLTGPAGSGKTTTIYACLRRLAEQDGRHVITVEDPVEQIIPGIMQTEVNEACQLDFARAARHLLRQDPQVLVIGEIRDEETASLAVRAGLTGHLVISTLHAGSCQGVFERLLTLCQDRYAVWSSLELVLNQRLIRRICRACGGNGCTDCARTGYRGRVPVVEWMQVDDSLRKRLREEAWQEIRPTSSLVAEGQRLWQSGVTNEAEFNRVFLP